jgi:hypothetical protein
MPAAPGFVIFGTPPIATADQMSVAFQPNPAMAFTFAPSISPDEARAYAEALNPPTLWRQELQLIPGAGRAPTWRPRTSSPLC